MNLKLRRTLSSFLAFVMLCSCMVVANVGTAFAATEYSRANVSIEGDGKVKKWDFTAATEDLTNLTSGDLIDGIRSEFNRSDYVRVRSASGTFYLNVRDSASIYVPIPANSAGEITVTGRSSDDRRLLTIEDDSTRTIEYTASPSPVAFTATDSADGWLKLTSNDDYQITVLSVTLTSEHTFTGGSVTPETYDLEFNVTPDVTYTIVYRVNNGEETTLNGNVITGLSESDVVTYTVRAEGYNDATGTVTMGTENVMENVALTATGGSTDPEDPVPTVDTTWNFNTLNSITAGDNANTAAVNDLGNGLRYYAGSAASIDSTSNTNSFDAGVAGLESLTGKGIRANRATNGDTEYFSFELAAGATFTMYYVSAGSNAVASVYDVTNTQLAVGTQLTDKTTLGSVSYTNNTAESKTIYVTQTGRPVFIAAALDVESEEISTFTVTVTVADESGLALSNANVRLSDGTTTYVALERGTPGTYTVDIPSGTVITSINVTYTGYIPYAETSLDISTALTHSVTMEKSQVTSDRVQVLYDANEQANGSITFNYNFSDGAGSNLVSRNDTEKLATSAYVTIDGGDSDTAIMDDTTNYVQLSTDGATLMDNSNTYATRLIIPYVEDAGITTVSGSIRFDGSVATGWTLVDLGAVSLRYNSGNRLQLRDGTNDNVVGTEWVHAINSGDTLDFVITLNLNNHTATADLAIDGETGSSNITLTTGEPMDWVAFITNNAGNIDGNSARTITVSNITINDTNAATIVPIGSPFVDDNTALLRRGFLYYVVSVISAADVENESYSKVVQYNTNGTPENTADDVKIDESVDVYAGIEVNGTVYTAENFGGNAGDYLFASYIDNTGGTYAIKEMRDLIYSNVVTVFETSSSDSEPVAE